MPTNQTPNYALSQWEKTDQVLMEDFNADNAKLDAALKAETDARTALASVVNQTLPRKGNCSIGLTSYIGTGKRGPDNPTRITFPRKPTVFIVFSPTGLLFGRGDDNLVSVSTFTSGGSVYNMSLPASWSGTTVSFYTPDGTEARFQANAYSNPYHVIAFYAED